MSYKKPKREIKPEYLNYVEAMKVFGLSADVIREMAIECGALIQIGRSVLVDYAKFKAYLDTFVVLKN